MAPSSMRAVLTVGCLLLLCVAAADRAGAEGRSRAGTAAAAELLIPVGARDIALGGASIATTRGLEALYWNPAGLANSEHNAGLLVSTMSYLAGIRVNYLAAGARFGRLGTLGVDLKSLSFGDIPITTERQPDGTGGTFSPTFLVFGAHLAHELSERIRVGASTHLVSNRIARVEATALSFSGGLQYARLGGLQGLTLGVAVKHIGSRMRYDGPGLLRRGRADDLRRPPADYKIQASSADLPSLFELGLAYDARPLDLAPVAVSTLFRHSNYGHDQLRTGVEARPGEAFSVRVGFDYAAGADDAYIYGTSFGFGLDTSVSRFEAVRLDYAYSTVDFFDPLSTFTLQVGF